MRALHSSLDTNTVTRRALIVIASVVLCLPIMVQHSHAADGFCSDFSACCSEDQGCSEGVNCILQKGSCSDSSIFNMYLCDEDTECNYFCSYMGICSGGPNDGLPCSANAVGTCDGMMSVCRIDEDCFESTCMPYDFCPEGVCQPCDTGCTEQADCDDNDECTSDDCIDNQCQYSVVSCDDTNECTDDSCDSVTGCLNSCNATGTEDPCCADPACSNEPICHEGVISFRFTGHVSEITDGGCSGPCLEAGVISVDDPVAGILTYDLDTSDSAPDPDLGQYVHDAPPSQFTATINGLIFQSDPQNTLLQFSVYNDSPSVPPPIPLNPPCDILQVLSPNDLFPLSDLGLDDPDILIVITMQSLSLADDTQTALPDDHLPSSLDLDEWGFAGGGMHMFGRYSPGYSDIIIDISYDIDTLDRCLYNETGLCSNGIDDDCDGLTDYDDPECWACTDPVECDDSDECTSDDCVDHQCQNSAVDCDDTNECTDDSCDSVTGCLNSCNATGTEDPCCADPACSSEPICQGGYPQAANTVAASHGKNSLIGSGVFNSLALLLIPVGGVIFLRILRRKR